MTMTQNCPSTMKMDLDADRAEGVTVQGAAVDAVVDVAEETKEVAGVDVMMEDSPRAPTNRCTMADSSSKPKKSIAHHIEQSEIRL